MSERDMASGGRGGRGGGGLVLALAVLLLLLRAAPPVAGQRADPPADGEAVAAAPGVRFVLGGVRAGLGGTTRAGEWTPLRVELENPTDRDAALTLSWWLPDAAGDRVRMRRPVAVPAGRTVAAWLYGVLPPGPAPAEGWPLVASAEGEAEAGTVVASASVLLDPARKLDAGEEVILQMSASDLGLGDYARHAASQAKRRLVTGLSLADLPDRVQGLVGVKAIVWAADGGGNPAAAGVPVQAISAWIRRGGHLVVVLPSVGERWTQSPLAPLLPLRAGVTPERRPVSLPTLGVTRPAGADAAEAWVMPEGDAAVLLRASGGEPLVITARRGFGAVTLVGIDLSAPLYRQASLPSGPQRFWSDVFGWSDPAVSERREAVLRGEASASPPKIKPARELPDVEIGRFELRSLGLSGSVTAALTVLMGLLILLPVLAGGLWLLARGRSSPSPAPSPAPSPGVAADRGPGKLLTDPVRWAWPVFAAVCVGGAAAAWGVAVVGRPAGLSARHQSVVDLDPALGLRRVRSRVSLFVPGFGLAAVRAGASEEAASVLLSTAGAPGDEEGGGFLDPQRYDLDAAEPDAVELPLRSTTRPLQIDRAEADVDPAARRVRLVGAATHRPGYGQLRVSLQSSLPVDLADVLLVYCPGEAYEGSARRPLPPKAWRLGAEAGGTPGVWPAGGTLAVDGLPARAVDLVDVPPLGEEAPGGRGGGWLNVVLDQSGLSAAAAPKPDAAVNDPVRAFEALSFFGRLPPPDTATVAPPYGGWLRRSLPDLVGLDLSLLTSAPRLFVLGHADGDALPLPLTVDGVEPPSSGRTVYRILVDLETPTR